MIRTAEKQPSISPQFSAGKMRNALFIPEYKGKAPCSPFYPSSFSSILPFFQQPCRRTAAEAPDSGGPAAASTANHAIRPFSAPRARFRSLSNGSASLPEFPVMQAGRKTVPRSRIRGRSICSALFREEFQHSLSTVQFRLRRIHMEASTGLNAATVIFAALCVFAI